MIENNNVNDKDSIHCQEDEEVSNKIQNGIIPIVTQQEGMKKIIEEITIPKFEVNLPTFDIAKELTSGLAANAAKNIMNDALPVNSALFSLGEVTSRLIAPIYQFENSALKTVGELSKNTVSNLITGINTLINSSVMKEIKLVESNLLKWLQTVDFSPLTSIIDSISSIGLDVDYKEANEAFLKAMFDARWFPYAGWIADFGMANDLFEILNTSRVSKNRIKRIDKLVFSFYNKEEINNLKRGWRKMNLPSYMIRILVQSVQAYHRREYALTVSTLSTLWEGIIQEKVNDSNYRVSKRTRENLTKLIKENEFENIFSSFCEEFIFYDCNKPEEVKHDVPGRHGIAHCWYDTYPNKKVALNAILFTDFLLGLKPIVDLVNNDNGLA